MKKIKCIISIILVFICFCSCAKTSNVNIKNIDAQSIEKHIKNGDINLEQILDEEHHLIAVFQSSIVIYDKETNKTKVINYNGANSIYTSQNKLYFFDIDKKSINRLDFENYKIESIYSSSLPIQQFYCIGNGNILIEDSDDEQFIYNINTNRRLDIFDANAYIGTDYYIDNDKTGIFINDRHIENLGYISDICKIGNDLYYKSDIEENNSTIICLSGNTYKKSVVLQFNTSENDKYIKECPKGLYDYHNRLFIYVGINQETDSSSNYENGELWELNVNGKIKQKYILNKIPDSSTFTFYDKKLFYCDINNRLNSIDL